MKIEDKQLVFADISARIPYGVKCHTINGVARIIGITKRISGGCIRIDVMTDKGNYPVEYIKLYLRPMSTMSEKEKDEYACVQGVDYTYDKPHFHQIDYCNAHFLDYRDLIKKNLALEPSKDIKPYIML